MKNRMLEGLEVGRRFRLPSGRQAGAVLVTPAVYAAGSLDAGQAPAAKRFFEPVAG